MTDETKEDLLARAQELDIAGRSSMTKDELAAAIEQAENVPSEGEGGHEALTEKSSPKEGESPGERQRMEADEPQSVQHYEGPDAKLPELYEERAARNPDSTVTTTDERENSEFERSQ